MKNLPRELTEAAQAVYYQRNSSGAPVYSVQSVDDIMKIVAEARTPAPVARTISGFSLAAEEDEEDEEASEQRQPPSGREEEAEDGDEEEDEYDKTVKQVHASGEFHVV